MTHAEFGEPDEVSDAQAADDEAWLDSLPAGQRALLELVIARMCEAARDSTHRPRR
ncbi:MULTISPECIES: hypothetical protein [Nocardiopsis]|uniref:Transposase n=1 Tax=Nocardiopsis changdeensis TaxID=2831969 RepID=A0ABX8BYT3_9ACTN|nr:MULTISPECIES: hypothetical protein [Nocardiopsis]QUX26354.1 hypothetical protein KGD84_32150 [Nocardiopsis changdeensis]QYX40826.1 hypothetical protein K1J57_33025 [Nocardiopsis sp. MT53]